MQVLDQGFSHCWASARNKICKYDKKEKKQKHMGFGSSSSPSTTPPRHSTQTHTLLCLWDPPPHSSPPLRPLIEIPPIPPDNQALAAAIGCANTPRLPEAPFPLPLSATVTPSHLPGPNLYRDEKHPSTKPRPGSGPLPSRTPVPNCRRWLLPLHPLCHCLWHSGHHHTTSHCQHPAL